MSLLEIEVPSSALLTFQLDCIRFRIRERRFSIEVDRDGFPRLVDEDAADRAFEDRAPWREEPLRRRVPPARRGRPWSPEEEVRLRDGFAAGTSLAELGRELGRTSGAVRARLALLGLIDASEVNLRYPVNKAGSERTGDASAVEE